MKEVWNQGTEARNKEGRQSTLYSKRMIIRVEIGVMIMNLHARSVIFQAF